MNCNNTPKCSEPCGDCTQEWPVPAGAQSPAEAHRFENVSCSQCGRDFGPGDSGFSHCSDHRLPAQAEEVAPVEHLKVIKGELCYQSKEDDQSFGMWVPVTPDADHGFANGTVLVASHPQPKAAGGNERPDLAFQLLAAANYIDALGGDSKSYRAAIEAFKAQPKHTDEPLFLLHCGQIDSGGEQGDWDIEADSGKRVEEFCRLHPGQTVNLYPHAQSPAVGAGPAPSQTHATDGMAQQARLGMADGLNMALSIVELHGMGADVIATRIKETLNRIKRNAEALKEATGAETTEEGLCVQIIADVGRLAAAAPSQSESKPPVQHTTPEAYE